VDVFERVREWRDQDLLERKERLASATGHGLRDRRVAERRRQSAASAGAAVQPARRSEVEIVVPVSVKDLCAALGAPFNVVSAKLLEHTGQLFTINQLLDADQAEMVALDLGISLRVVKPQTELEKLEAEFAARPRTNLMPRPPVVAMLGHVDHGKTSLLDAIRKTRVAAGEAGGITQHVGAYRLTRGGWDVTFLDTPGHEAFTAMRARGANLTDVVVLVVAADDGVMPQTIEAINHARAAGVPIVVALNKVDLPGVDFNRLYAQLAEQDLTPTEWGGNTDVIRTSAVKGQGIEELVAHLSTLSELLDLKADPSVPARATVIEAQIAEGRGVVAQVLVHEGTLRAGQVIVCGEGFGRVRSLLDDSGRRIREAPPGTPVEVGGLDVLPRPGDRLYVVEDLSRAKRIAEEVRAARRAEALVAVRKPQTLEDLLRGDERGEVPELNVIIKADGQASVDALRSKLQAFPADKARLRLLHSGVGAISEADVMLAQASRAVIFGFWVTAEERARQLAEQVGVEIRLYRVIYEIIEDMQKALEGLLAPLRREEVRGRAEVLQIFNIARVGTVAGCAVRDGVVSRSNRVRLIRDGRIVMEDLTLASLKRFKEDAREVRAGLECGIKLEAYDDLKPGDVLETYEVVEVAQRL
jgi:translation initiation factor IF-2